MSTSFAGMVRNLTGQKFKPLTDYLKERIEQGLASASALVFPQGSAAAISVAQSTTVGAAGASLTVSAAAGAAATASAVGGTGGAYAARSGAGGAASSAQVAGASGAAAFRSGTGGAGSAARAAGASGAVTVGSGDAGANGGGGGAGTGNVAVDAGAPTGAGTAGTVSIAATNAEALSLGRTGKTTTVNGALAVTQATSLNGDVNLGDGAADTLAIKATARLYNGAGTQYTALTTNASATRAVAFPDVAGTVVTTGDTATVTSAMLAGNIPSTKAAASFSAADVTGTGAPQNVAHGLLGAPAMVLLIPVAGHDGAGGAGDKMPTLAPGLHNATNVVCTVSAGAKFRVFAWL